MLKVFKLTEIEKILFLGLRSNPHNDQGDRDRHCIA